MPTMFWLCVALGYTAGFGFSFVLARFAVRRVSEDSPQAPRVRQAGISAAAVASLPALFFATVLGGTLGGSLAAGIGNRFAFSAGAQQVFTGAGVGIGVLCVMVVTIVATAIAGAVFMKVYLAR